LYEVDFPLPLLELYAVIGGVYLEVAIALILLVVQIHVLPSGWGRRDHESWGVWGKDNMVFPRMDGDIG